MTLTFTLESGEVMYLHIPVDDARMLAIYIDDFLSGRADREAEELHALFQSSSSSGIPSDEGSPNEGHEQEPLAAASAADAGEGYGSSASFSK